MKKTGLVIIGSSALIVVSLVFTQFTFAENSTNTGSSEHTPKPILQRLEIRHDIKDNFKDKIETKHDDNQASREGKRCELRKSFVKAYFERMLERLSALIDRLQKLIDRIQSRFDKIDASGKGIDLTGPKADLSDAKTKLADAKSKLETLKASETTFLSCDNPTGTFKTVKEQVDGIKNDLKDVYKSLVHIIGNIKGLRIGEGEHSPKPTATP